MDTRYHIEEMVSQDERGVVFQGTDSVTGVIVAIRRFISSGGNETEVTPDLGKSFDELVVRLKELNHPSLRRILAGGCDPVDNMPYLVARWCEGRPLTEMATTFGVSGPDPEFVRQLLVDFMDANAAVEEVVGRRGLWLETSTAATFVRPVRGDAERPAALFWLCPWSWLREGGADDVLLPALADLAEELLGGPRKIGVFPAYSQWIAAIRKRGVRGDEEARAALLRLRFETDVTAVAAGPAPPDRAVGKSVVASAAPGTARGEDPAGFDAPGLKVLPAPVVAAPAVVVLPGSPADRRGIGRKTRAAAVVLLVGAGLAFFMSAKRSTDATPVGDVDPGTANFVPESAGDGAAAMRSRIPDGAEAERRDFVARRGYFTIDEGDLMHALDQQEVTFRGRLANVRNSSSGLTMYLEFSDEPPNDEPRAFSMVRNQPDGIQPQDLEPLKGRLVEIRGKVDLETVGSIRRPRVELRDAGSIKLLDDSEDYELR